MRHLTLIKSLLRFSFRSLTRELLRSTLTALSLIIGIAAVIAMIGIGNGAKASIQASIAQLDANQLVLLARMKTREGGMQMAFPGSDGLNVEDYHAIRDNLRSASAVSLKLEMPFSRAGAITARGRVSTGRIVGIDVAGFKLDSHEIIQGTFFGPADVGNATSVCVINRSAANTLFPSINPVGLFLQLNKVPFRVIGVIEDKDSASDPNGLRRGGDQVLVPFTSLLRRLDRNADASMQIVMRAESPLLLDEMQRQMSSLMELRRGTRKAEFTTSSIGDTVQLYTRNSRTMALLLTFIGAISLLVGGIGIMNVMLMSVTERTREIGIRMAIGARERDVLGQMLLEAVVLSLLGGVIGILVGIGIAKTITHWNGWPWLITPGSIAATFLISAGIGVFFGYYPARRAARLNPIEALRAS